MTDFIVHSNGTTIHTDWNAEDIDNHIQGLRMMDKTEREATCPQHLDQIRQDKRELEACKSALPWFFSRDIKQCVDSMSQDANLYLE